jgi:hypothetical protein
VTGRGLSGDTQIVVPSDPPGGVGRAVDCRSTDFDLRILEYRPCRAFGANQSSAILFQLFAGADYPRGAKVAYPPGAPAVDLRPVYSVGVRMGFDWRHYY